MVMLRFWNPESGWCSNQLQAKKCKISGWKTSKFNVCKVGKKDLSKWDNYGTFRIFMEPRTIFPTAWKPFQPSAQSREMLVLPSNNFLRDRDFFLISLKNDLHLLFSTSLSWRLRSSMDLEMMKINRTFL